MFTYFIPFEVLDKYRNECKNEKNKDRETCTMLIIKMKLTAKIKATWKHRIKLNKNREVYLHSFGGFNMVVDEENARICDIYWDDPSHQNIYGNPQPRKLYNLICKNMGLNARHNRIVKDIDKVNK